ncbi:hypothetical protein EDB89DRAFT_2244763 [Lactarius sanguifluus]|nr:hypothetical protein EDB89DRAFT_2244763 [Lactarius sanguifluus]
MAPYITKWHPCMRPDSTMTEALYDYKLIAATSTITTTGTTAMRTSRDAAARRTATQRWSEAVVNVKRGPQRPVRKACEQEGSGDLKITPHDDRRLGPSMFLFLGRKSHLRYSTTKTEVYDGLVSHGPRSVPVRSVVVYMNYTGCNQEDPRIQLLREGVEHDAANICAHPLNHNPASASVSVWVLGFAQATAMTLPLWNNNVIPPVVAVVVFVMHFIIVTITMFVACFVMAVASVMVTLLSLRRGRGRSCVDVIIAVAVVVSITVGVAATWSGWGGRGVAAIAGYDSGVAVVGQDRVRWVVTWQRCQCNSGWRTGMVCICTRGGDGAPLSCWVQMYTKQEWQIESDFKSR